MISVREDDRRVDLIQQLSRRNSFDRSLRTYRHERRRRNDAVIRMEQARPGAGERALRLDFESHSFQLNCGYSGDLKLDC